jgi:hypothetical protein
MSRKIASIGNAQLSFAIDDMDGIVISDTKGILLAKVFSKEACIINLYRKIDVEPLEIQ